MSNRNLLLVTLVLIALSLVTIALINPGNDRALRGHAGNCVMQADGTGPYKASHYDCIPYQSTMCLLPSSEESYIEPSTPHAAIVCVNTGKVATQSQLDALIFADHCVDGGYVPCAPSCFLQHLPVPCSSKHDEVQQ